MAYKIGLLFGIVFCFAADLAAQNPYRMEIFGSLGVAQYALIPVFGSGGTSGINVGGGGGVRPFSTDHPAFRSLGVEFESNITRTSTRFGSQTQGYFTGNLVLNFPARRVEPYFLIGAGISHDEGITHRAADLGGGVRIFLNPHISLRPEFRAMVTEYLGNIARGSVAIGYHWGH